MDSMSTKLIPEGSCNIFTEYSIEVPLIPINIPINRLMVMISWPITSSNMKTHIFVSDAFSSYCLRCENALFAIRELYRDG